MITIVDFGMGNLKSIQNMLKKVGHQSVITSEKSEIDKAEKLILPGVGAFDNAMENLHKLNLVNTLNKMVLENGVPVLGVCLGMQLMGEGSEEGKSRGLGWINAYAKKFDFGSVNGLKIPHMGWNVVIPKDHKTLFKEMTYECRFYFVHSYYVVCESSEDILAETNHGINFTCAVNKKNIYGTHFHPEKSHKFGMKLLKNFAEETG